MLYAANEFRFNEQEKSRRHVLYCDLPLNKVLGNHMQIKELFYYVDLFVSAAKVDKTDV